MENRAVVCFYDLVGVVVILRPIIIIKFNIEYATA